MLKKTFFDCWDNLYRMFFLNFGYIVVLASGLPLSYFIRIFPVSNNINYLIVTIYIVFVFHVYNGAVYGMTRDIADYKNPGFKDFFTHLKKSFPSSLLFAFLLSILITLCFISLSIYLGMNVFFKYFAIFTIISILFTVIIATQYFFPIYYGLDKRFFKIIKKMFLIFLDNPLFSFGLFFFNIIFMAIAVMSAMIIPGLSSITLLLNEGLKLRLYKYDYLEEHPDLKSKIPWDALLIEDREKVGKRTLKGMIFPWKE
ncbi:MAG: hypothetical protein JXB88_04500 [Spirochaetales bacterium]|nr:hypothetical protein [Spirochaetales bacterium]